MAPPPHPPCPPAWPHEEVHPYSYDAALDHFNRLRRHALLLAHRDEVVSEHDREIYLEVLHGVARNAFIANDVRYDHQYLTANQVMVADGFPDYCTPSDSTPIWLLIALYFVGASAMGWSQHGGGGVNVDDPKNSAQKHVADAPSKCGEMAGAQSAGGTKVDVEGGCGSSPSASGERSTTQNGLVKAGFSTRRRRMDGYSFVASIGLAPASNSVDNCEPALNDDTEVQVRPPANDGTESVQLESPAADAAAISTDHADHVEKGEAPSTEAADAVDQTEGEDGRDKTGTSHTNDLSA
ncbi:hypothetical protein AB1Y20_000516 [Prymnesium parvum]|uniref:Uncharacterized protein n=1 Tax=Prymnesium parvum TaxID=97485 RepID=A0AB34K8C8_PRYPA